MQMNLLPALKRLSLGSTGREQSGGEAVKSDFARVWPAIDRVEGLLVPGQEQWLFSAASRTPDEGRIVEIGCYKGRSTVSLAFGCVGTRKKVFSIDLFGGVYHDVAGREHLEGEFAAGFFETWHNNLTRNGLSGYVTPLVGPSQQIVRHWRAPIHGIFIDGSHEFEDVLADFESFYPYVVPGGWIALHDVIENWEGPYRAWHDCIKHRLIECGNVSTLAFGRKPARNT